LDNSCDLYSLYGAWQLGRDATPGGSPVWYRTDVLQRHGKDIVAVISAEDLKRFEE